MSSETIMFVGVGDWAVREVQNHCEFASWLVDMQKNPLHLLTKNLSDDPYCISDKNR